MVGAGVDELLLNEFSAESRKFLQAAESDLAALSQTPPQVSPPLFKRLFRVVHSIKSSAAFLNLQPVNRLGQGLETVLLNLQEGRLEVSPALIQSVAAAFDLLQQYVDSPLGLGPEETPRICASLENSVHFEAKRVKTPETVAGSGGETPVVHQEIETDKRFQLIDQGPSPAIGALIPAASLNMVSVSIDRQLDEDHDPVKLVVSENSLDSDHHGLGPDQEFRHIILAMDELSPSITSPSPGPPWTTNDHGAITETIRIPVQLIDQMMNLAGELVLGRNQLRLALAGALDQIRGLGTVMQHVDLVTTDLQEQILQLRMQPVGNVLNKFPRIVQDLSRQLSKEVELFIEGGKVELDKSIIEVLSDPLTHLIRNCLDHGLEPPDERLALGKKPVGHISIKAFHEEGQVNITVSDDGRGMDLDKIVHKALSAKLLDALSASKMTDAEKINLIFLPGFSTATTVTDVSGRGVGMDVVRTNIEQVGGRLEIETVLTRGTTVRLRLPLTLAIIPSLVVRVGNQIYAIPQMDVQELVCVQVRDIGQRLETIGEAQVLRVRGRLLPLVRLADLFNLTGHYLDYRTNRKAVDRRVRLTDRRQPRTMGNSEIREESEERERSPLDRRQRSSGDVYIAILRVGAHRYGLVVDELLTTEEIVVKPLSIHLKESRCYSGATIMGDGKVAMILSAAGIAEVANLRFTEVSAEERRRQEKEAAKQKPTGPARQLLVFNNAWNEFFAVPLKDITRLEIVPWTVIGRIGSREYVNYNGAGLPLIRLEKYLRVAALPTDLGEVYFLVPKVKGFRVGILASRFVDIIEVADPIQPERGKRPGVTGSVMIDGHMTLCLQLDELISVFRKENLLDPTGVRAA